MSGERTERLAIEWSMAAPFSRKQNKLLPERLVGLAPTAATVGRVAVVVGHFGRSFGRNAQKEKKARGVFFSSCFSLEVLYNSNSAPMPLFFFPSLRNPEFP